MAYLRCVDRLVPLMLFGVVRVASAAEPAWTLRDYTHTVWTHRDGISLSDPIGIVQSSDGYLWFTALRSLCSSTTNTSELASAFQRAIDECRNDSTAEAPLVVQGQAQERHPAVRDEVYRIGYEAIRSVSALSCRTDRGEA